MEPRNLIDWLKNWCPRDTLLKSPSSRKLSPNKDIFGDLIRSHPLSILLMILTLTGGLGGFLIPDTFMPVSVKVWVLTGSNLSLDRGGVGGIDWRITTSVITPPYGGAEVPYAVVETSIGGARIEDRGALVATTFSGFTDHNVTVIGDTCLGYETEPEWNNADVEMSRGELHFGVYLHKYDIEKLIGEGGGPPLEHFEVNLLSLEAAESVEPPYNLTCRGVISHKLESGIDSIYGKHRLIFWNIHVEEDNLTVTRYADLPQEELLIVNPWLKTLQDSRLLLIMISILMITFLYHTTKL